MHFISHRLPLDQKIKNVSRSSGKKCLKYEHLCTMWDGYSSSLSLPSKFTWEFCLKWSHSVCSTSCPISSHTCAWYFSAFQDQKEPGVTMNTFKWGVWIINKYLEGERVQILMDGDIYDQFSPSQNIVPRSDVLKTLSRSLSRALLSVG